MAVSVTKAGPYYSSGEIKFSSLRSNFRAQVRRETSGGSESFSTDNNSISASQLLRNTTTTNTSPIVPDAQENANISTSNNWRTSQFRNSIKYYYVTLPSSDDVTNFDIDAQTWNSNLNKNIVKVMFIDGTCGSNSVSSTAASFNATAYNLTFDVYGSILGAAGRGGGTGSGAPDPSGQSGGNALSIESSNGNNIVVLVRTGSRIYGAGGGGERGNKGADGTSGKCRQEEYKQSGCQQSNTVSCSSGWSQYQSGNWCCETKRGCNANYWWVRCERYYSTAPGIGGAGGTGGLGRGYNNQSGSLSGASGSGGTSGGDCGATAGKTGETGGDGGEWAKAGSGTNNSGNGGGEGKAIVGSNYSVTGTINSDTVKGAYNP